MKSARKWWLAAHLWLGLTLGALFALLGATGSALVFYLELDRWLHPEIRASASGPAATPDAIVAALRRALPARDGPWRIELPLTPGAPLMARYLSAPEKADHAFAPLIVTLDPSTLAITSERFWGEFALTWIYDLHYSLLLGHAGRAAVGYAGLAVLVSLLSGLWLWWPGRGRVAAALRPRLRPGSARRNYDLHVLSGLYGLPLVLVLCLTGAALALPEETRALLRPLSPAAPAPALPPLAATASPAVGATQALEMARRRFPAAEPRWLETPGAHGGPWRIVLHQAGEPGRRFPRTQVWIDPASGALLAERDPRRDGAGDTLLRWLHPLHNGEAFGLPGRLLAFVGGLLPVLLFATGLIRWRQKRRARRAGDSRRSPSAAGAAIDPAFSRPPVSPPAARESPAAGP